MNRILPVLVSLFWTVAAVLSAQTIAIVHATAYLVPGEPATKNATIVMEQGRIAAAGAALPVPANARRIDAQNQIVTPGLMDSDTQLGLVEAGSADSTDSAASSGPFGAAFDIQYALNPNSTLLPVARADGLTRAVTLPTGSAHPPFLGFGAVLCLREGIEILDRPRAVMTAVVGGMATPQTGGSRSAQWQLIRYALAAARQPRSAAPATDPIFSPLNLEALQPVLRREIPLAITAGRESDIRQAVALADQYKIRVVLIGAEEAWRAAPLLASHHIPVVLNPYADDPSTFDQIGSRLDNAALLARAGVPVSFFAPSVHTSHNAGITIRTGAGIAVANGLPWNIALKALTLTPAETWGIANHYGMLKPGKDADLVIWSGDPLEPETTPLLVFVRGRQVSLDTRQRTLERRYASHSDKDHWPPAYR